MSKAPLEVIHSLENDVKESIQNSNKLKTLVDMMEDGSYPENIRLALVHALRRVFVHVLEGGHMMGGKAATEEEEEGAGNSKKMRKDDGSALMGGKAATEEEEGASSSKKMKKEDGSALSIQEAVRKVSKWLLEQFNRFVKLLVSLLYYTIVYLHTLHFILFHYV
jgi:hypothetical protein